MNRKIFLSVMTLSALLLSCKKEKMPEIPGIAYDNYSNLKVGNYWVYQRFTVDESGNETATSVYDSCYIEKDTVINSKKYFKYCSSNGISVGSPGFPEYLRDSLHYIVNSAGNVLFSSWDYINNLHQSFHVENADTLVRYTMKMTDKDAVTSTPFGNFTTSNAQLELYTYPAFTFTVNPRYVNVRYAKDVGIVTKVLDFYWSLASYTELRLVRYHVA